MATARRARGKVRKATVKTVKAAKPKKTAARKHRR